MAVKRVWWQHHAGVVTRFWTTGIPPEGPGAYRRESEAIHAARQWLDEEINRLQSRARALDRREAEAAEESRDG